MSSITAILSSARSGMMVSQAQAALVSRNIANAQTPGYVHEILPISAALGGLGFEFDQRAVIEEFTRHHMAVLWRDGVRIDWLKPLLPAYRHVLERARTEPAPGGAVRVATAEGLILLKLFAFRLQDQTDIEALVAANRGALDIDWITSEWQTVFEPDDRRMHWFLGLLADSP
jgi:hypothetical protein